MEDSLLDVRYIICDVGGENRPTGAYFITEFDLTKVVIGIFVRKFSMTYYCYIGQARFIDTQAVVKLKGFPEI